MRMISTELQTCSPYRAEEDSVTREHWEYCVSMASQHSLHQSCRNSSTSRFCG